MRMLVRLLFPLRRLLLKWLRIRTYGVKVIVQNARGELLLIRNSYGDSRLFLLPGGGIGRREHPAAAAAREVREETGVEVRRLDLVGTYVTSAEGKRDTVYLFRATAEGEPVADPVEVKEAAFFPLDALPPAASLATRRRIAELRSGSFAGGAW